MSADPCARCWPRLTRHSRAECAEPATCPCPCAEPEPCQHPRARKERLLGYDTGDMTCPDCGSTWPRGTGPVVRNALPCADWCRICGDPVTGNLACADCPDCNPMLGAALDATW